MPVNENQNFILQVTDSVTTRKCALRIDPQDARLPWERLLEIYLKNPSIEQLCKEGRITSESTENLLAIQDLVYVSDDDGCLHSMFAGLIVKQDDRPLAPRIVPDVSLGRAREKDVAVIDLTIDRTGVGYSRNWVGFHKRRWSKNETVFVEFARSAVERNWSLE